MFADISFFNSLSGNGQIKSDVSVFNRRIGEVVSIPTWALNYIFNGEIEGLEDGEQEMIERWLGRFGSIVGLSPIEEESYFTNCPPFGLPGDVQDFRIAYDTDEEGDDWYEWDDEDDDIDDMEEL